MELRAALHALVRRFPAIRVRPGTGLTGLPEELPSSTASSPYPSRCGSDRPPYDSLTGRCPRRSTPIEAEPRARSPVARHTSAPAQREPVPLAGTKSPNTITTNVAEHPADREAGAALARAQLHLAGCSELLTQLPRLVGRGGAGWRASRWPGGRCPGHPGGTAVGHTGLPHGRPARKHDGRRHDPHVARVLGLEPGARNRFPGRRGLDSASCRCVAGVGQLCRSAVRRHRGRRRPGSGRAQRVVSHLLIMSGTALIVAVLAIGPARPSPHARLRERLPQSGRRDRSVGDLRSPGWTAITEDVGPRPAARHEVA